MLTVREIHYLLYDLCVELGFCLSPEQQEQLEQNPPPTVRDFTDAVFYAEGLEPGAASRTLYRQVTAIVAHAFAKSEEAASPQDDDA